MRIPWRTVFWYVCALCLVTLLVIIILLPRILPNIVVIQSVGGQQQQVYPLH